MAAFLLAILLSFVPAAAYALLLYHLDRFEREPRMLVLASFLWGAIVATTGAMIGSFVLRAGVMAFTSDEAIADATGTVLFAPVVEEITKGAAVFLVFLLFRREFDSVLDGMVYAGVTALGFAATENVLYLYFIGFAEGGYAAMFTLFVVRVILGGWLHAAYTAAFGIGLALARLSPSPTTRIIAPLAGLAAAMVMHAIHNGMATFLSHTGFAGLAAILLVDWLGWAIMLGLLIAALLAERRWIRRYLQEEVAAGLLSQAEYAAAGSIRAQLRARLSIRGARAFYQAVSELALKKHQLATLGDEDGTGARILALRAVIAGMRGVRRAH